MKKGIDVSKHQGVVNFDQVKASGAAEFVMIRAVSTNKYGIYIDPQFERNYAECKRLGIPVGAVSYTHLLQKHMCRLYRLHRALRAVSRRHSAAKRILPVLLPGSPLAAK